MHASRLTKTYFVYCLVSLDCRLRLLEFFFFFFESFSKKETALSFFFLLDYASRTCAMPRQDCFVRYLLPSHVKYYLNSQNFPPF